MNTSVQTLTIKPTRNGRGIFTNKKLKKGEVALVLKGIILSANELDKIGGQTNDNSFRFGPKTYLSPQGELGDFLNHSCEPNCGIRKTKQKLQVVAIKNISKNCELCIDYSTILAPDDEWQMLCNCGSTKCRKLIKAFNQLPASLQSKYQKIQIVPEYILSY